jgi:hypothetical protein
MIPPLIGRGKMAKKAIEIEKGQAQKRKRREKRHKKRVKKNMSDAARLYRVVLRQLRKQPTSILPENQMTLAMMITGILRGRSGQLRKMANAVQYNGKKESLIDRFRRFVRNPTLEVAVEYAPFGQRLLKAIGQGPIVLMIDSTQLGGQGLCLMVSVYYKSRALPLAWVTYKGRKGHSSQQVQLHLFQQVKALLPTDVPVVLVGDGEFDGSEVVDWFDQDSQWRFVCRTDKTNKVFYQEHWLALHQLPLTEGQDAFFSGLRFTEKNQVGPVNILAVWHQARSEHWFFVTNCQTAAEAKAFYTLRFTTETLFSDLKGRGFNLDDTRLWQSDRLQRLLLPAAIAYFFMVVLGVEAIVSGVFRQLVRTDAFYHTLFQLGLFYLNHIFYELLDFPSLTDLPPPHTFEHVVIS